MDTEINMSKVTKDFSQFLGDMLCENCSHKFAEMKIDEKTRRRILVISESDMMLKIIDKEKNQATLICPQCGHETPFDLRYIKNF